MMEMMEMMEKLENVAGPPEGGMMMPPGTGRFQSLYPLKRASRCLTPGGTNITLFGQDGKSCGGE
ncbi:MAG: hypothetical protein N2039_12800, partial [Gemmataceae bacterium]|nr:hypothetical protein [Gemmataceae bacterium]